LCSQGSNYIRHFHGNKDEELDKQLRIAINVV